LEISEGIDSGESLSRIVHFVDRGPTLLVLDNCEHLVDRVASLTRELLSGCPSLRVLTTSREPLGVTGEIARPVPPLPISDALALFVERAEAVRAEPDDLASPTLEVLCRDLDCMPLAIELAAARLRTMRLTTLVRELGDRFQVLTRGDRTALPRQQTL